MHVAAGIGYDWGVKALLDANADPYVKDKMNRSAVEYAEQKGQRSCVQAIREAQTQRDEVAQTAALPLEKAVKKVIDEDDAQQLYEVLQRHAKRGRIESGNVVLIFLTAGRVSVEGSSAAESCWYSPLFDLHAAAACREYAYAATRHVHVH
jgi:hypothetical protein